MAGLTDLLPLKQGLRQIYSLIFLRISITLTDLLPLKQGLRLAVLHDCGRNSVALTDLLPLKQGLRRHFDMWHKCSCLSCLTDLLPLKQGLRHVASGSSAAEEQHSQTYFH